MRISSALRTLSINEHLVMAVLATMVGLAAGFGTLGFRHLIGFFQLIAYGSTGNILEVIEERQRALGFPMSWKPLPFARG